MSDAADELPAFAEWRAPAGWAAIDFVSDLHLADDTPATLARFVAHVERTDADALVVLGDLFEVWVGDDARDAPVARQVADALAAFAARRPVRFMAGNRDFLVGATMLDACGAGELRDPTILDAFGTRVVLTHGDRLCIADIDYQRFRAQVRSTAWREAFLARPLAERLAVARAMRDASEARKRLQGSDQWADADPALALTWARAAGASALVHGHTHRPASDELAAGIARHVLSDWDLDHADPPRAEVLRWRRGGAVRMAPA